MNCFRQIWLVVPALLLVGCGGSGKSSETPAAASEPAAKSEVSPESTAAAAKSESSKPKAEEAAPESTEPECTKDKDCSIFADCCTCKAYPVAGKLPQPCDAVCGESKCEVKGKTIDNVACVSGRCKVK